MADSLPVVVSGTGVEQLLGVPNLPSDTRDGQATAVAKVLQEWRNSSGMVNRVYAMMSTNTGHRNGSCMLLEQKLEKDLLYLFSMSSPHS